MVADGHRVVIVGAGFGGLAAARALRGAPCSVTVIDRRNYHLFQPLLYQVATASLSPADVAWPIRSLLKGQRNARCLMGRVTGVDRATRCVRLEDGTAVPWDTLVLATGARHSYFGRDEWEPFAPGLKKIDDATEIRQRVLLAFERAEREADPAAREALLTFVVIGGGPTGVEMAGAIAELARQTLATDFRSIDPRMTRVVLVEAGARVLPQFDERLSARAKRDLEALGVEVRLSARVTEVTANGIAVGEAAVRAGTVIWGAGVAASPAGKWLGGACDRVGRVVVRDDLTVPDADDVFVIGDTAAVAAGEGKLVPGVAAAAKQMGWHVGETIAARLAGRTAARPFRYRDPGILATIGRNKAVAQMGPVRLAGFPAWFLWAVAHIYFLIGARNRLLVTLSWMWTYTANARGARLITSAEHPGGPAPVAPMPAE